jgi:Fur family zinc uptake transcriptional regulator
MVTMDEPRLNLSQAATLRALRAAGRPLTAYEVLDTLRAERRSAAPPTAYRALARLMELGLVHRLESLNAYVACCAEHDSAGPAFSICDDCGTVDEITDPRIGDGIAAAARRGGFEPVKSVIELHGRCAGCREEA